MNKFFAAFFAFGATNRLFNSTPKKGGDFKLGHYHRTAILDAAIRIAVR